ncbi:MAG: M24 family metallopeptidase [Gemmataceae bacterium]
MSARNISGTQISLPALPNPTVHQQTQSDRRIDIEAKQQLVAKLLATSDCDGLLLLDPANFAWFTSGGIARGVIDPASLPVIFCTQDHRWVISSNVDTQRIFDEELDELGFLLKEWPWHSNRTQLLRDLCNGRRVACDQTFGELENIGSQICQMRQNLALYEEACYRALGKILGHALEATCRTLQRGDTEREIAGQLSHRLIHRGVLPLVLTALVDGRSSMYRQGGFTPTPVNSYCVLLAAAQKYGLCAMASRTVAFGEIPEHLKREHTAACRVLATYVASTWPAAVPKQILNTARRIYRSCGAEHEWRLSPQGHITGRSLVELPLTPTTEDLLPSHAAITWRASIRSALSCDTFLVNEDGPRTLTIAENWPLKKLRIQGAEFTRPDILLR